MICEYCTKSLTVVREGFQCNMARVWNSSGNNIYKGGRGYITVLHYFCYDDDCLEMWLLENPDHRCDESCLLAQG